VFSAGRIRAPPEIGSAEEEADHDGCEGRRPQARDLDAVAG
jgi:hypothetical protein